MNSRRIVLTIGIFLGFSCLNNNNENLVKAASLGNFEEIRKMLNKGAQPDFRDATGKTPLQILLSLPDISQKNFEMESILIEFIQHGADINQMDAKGNTALFYAIESGNYDLTRSLVHHGANVNHRNQNLHTPLFKAVGFTHRPGIEISGMDLVRILYQAGGDIFLKDKEGKNLMHSSRDPMITAWLMEKGLSPKLRDNYGKTPLDYFTSEIFKARDSIAEKSSEKNKN